MSLRWVFALSSVVFALTLAGCSDDGDKKPIVHGQGPLHRLQVTPAAVVLTSAQETATLKVRGFDANGIEVPILPPTFESSRITEIAASVDGVLSAVGTTGSALIYVRVGNIVATPVSALAVRLKDGVIPIRDEQVIFPPVRLSSMTPGANEIRFTLQGTPPIAVGSMLIGTGATPIAGRVLAVRPAGGNTEVDLRLTPATEIVQDLSINLQYSPQHVLLQPEAPKAQMADPSQFSAPELQFHTDDPIAKSTSTTPRLIAASSKMLGAFECKSEADLTPFTGEFEAVLMPPQVGFSIIDRIVAGQRVASETIAEGTIEAKAKAVFRLGATVAASITCELKLGRVTVPVAGFASIIVAPSLPLRFTSQLAGVVSAGAFTFGIEGNLQASVKLGLRMVEGSDSIESFKKFDVTHTVSRTATFPTDAGIRGKAALFFGFGSGLDLSIGNLGTAALASWSIIKLEAGPELELKTGTLYDLALDDIYNSEYELKFKLAAGPGETIESAIETFFLTGKAVDLAAKVEIPLARSPQASAISVDRERFVAGDVLNFKVTLNPANLEFPGVGYNLKEVRIYRLTHDTPTGAQLVASATAQAGQLEFTVPWTAASAGDVVDSLTSRPNFFAYFVDVPLASLSTILPFELGRVVPTNRTIVGAGLTWAPAANQGGGLFVRSVAFASDSVAVAVGRKCPDGNIAGICTTAMFRSTDAGLSWSEVVLPANAGALCGLTQVAFGDARHGVASGNCLLTTSDSGLNWIVALDPERVPSTVGGMTLGYVGPNTILLVGDGSTTLRSADGGKTWRSGSARAGSEYISRFATDRKGLVLGSGGTNSMWVSTDGGGSWVSAGVRDTNDKVIPYVGMIQFVEGKTFVAGTYGSLLRSTDQGRTWAKVAVAGMTDMDYLDPSAFADSKTGLALMIRTSFFGVQTKVLFRTEDGGLTWSEMPGSGPMAETVLGNMVFSSAGVGLVPHYHQLTGTSAGFWRSVPMPAN